MGVYSNMALAEVAKENNVPSNPAQFMIEAYRNDLSLFNAVIECDFATALGEAGIIVFTEADQAESDKVRKEGLIAKIKQAISNAIAFVVKKAKEFADVLTSLGDKDKSLYTKFDKVITADAIKGCEAKCEYPNDDKIGDTLNKIDDLASLDSALSKIDSATSAEEVTKILEDLKATVNASINDISEKGAMDKFFNIEDKPVVDKIKDFDYLKEAIKTGYKVAKKTMEAHSLGVKRSLDLALKDVEASKKNEKDELLLAKLNAKGNYISSVINLYTKHISFTEACLKRAIKDYRKAYSLLGVYCTNKKSGADTKDAETQTTEAYAIGMFSDAVVDEAFAF